MTLVKTNNRRRPNLRKVSGEHHRKNEKYTKTYWPYLPIVLILGGSLVASKYLPASFGKPTAVSYSTRAGSVFGSTSQILVDGLYVLLASLAIWYVVRHFKRIKQLIIGGEHLLARNYVLDVALALVIGGLYILVR